MAKRCAASSMASSSMPSMPSVPLISASPSLDDQGERRQPGPAERSAAADPVAVLALHPALAEQDQRAVGERREVARGAQRAVFGHPGCDVVVEQVHQTLRHGRAHPGVAQRERRHPQQHHGAYHLAGHRRAHAGGVRPDQSVLQVGPALRRDRRARQGPESGGDAVDRPAVTLDRVHDGSRGLHGGDRGGGDVDAGATAGHGEHVVGADAVGLDGDDGHSGTPLCST